MYDDFRKIDDCNLKKLLEEYSKNIRIKAENYETDLSEEFLKLTNSLNNAKHYLHNLANLENSSNNIVKLEKIYDDINAIYEKINNLYDRSETEEYNFSEEKNTNNYMINIKELLNSLLDTINSLFIIYEYENNIKIINSLGKIFLQLIEIIRQVNNIEITKPKIYSLFKRNKNL